MNEIYDPVRGWGCYGQRVDVDTPVPGLTRAMVPVSMVTDADYNSCRFDPTAWQRLRCRHDFEYWAARCATIKHKTTGCEVPLVLNKPQRRVLAAFEGQRRAGRPVRAIMLKARQWGGSTLVQAYMAWIQTSLRRNWHSIICAQVKDTSSGIRGMFSKILDNYPRELWDGDADPAFRPYERSSNVRLIAGRGCRVTVSSIENQDAVRGADFAMAHLSEVAYWRPTPSHTPEDVVRAIVGSVPMVADSLVVLESTANGVGNYFHSEWLRSEAGLEGRLAIFVPWYEIDYYRLSPPMGTEALWASLTDYEQGLRSLGCSADQIYWYRCKLAELGSHDKMMAEFPTTAAEAFTATGHGVFERADVEALRAGCTAVPVRGDVGRDGSWHPRGGGETVVWEYPRPGIEYVVAVDIGGRTPRADYSVITVMAAVEKPRVVAQWRGHIDYDLLAARAMALGTMYDDALLAVESNSLETEGGTGLYVLDLLARSYPNLYRRRVYDDLTRRETSRIGFHTNRATKEMLVCGLQAAVRNRAYVERDPEACNELLTYERTPTGSYAAKVGCHDDLVMTRAIALHVIDHLLAADGPDIGPLKIPGIW